jgi:hypothetical protein
MARKWTESELLNGVGEFTLTSWNYFSDFVDKEMLDFREYMYRGHESEKWLLEPTLNRLAKGKTKKELTQIRKTHLLNFRYALRGRVSNSNKYKDDDELWALGQHNGLATPLLDWTLSPYVAAYFALHQSTKKTGYSVVYAINKDAVEEFKDLKIVNPITDENTRLINQSGLFTKVLTNKDIESMIRTKYKGEVLNYQMLKIRIPNKHRNLALRSLNRMNINHNTLFPDIQGASIYCNTEIEIDKY